MPAFCFEVAISSSTVRAGTALLVASTYENLATVPTATKSLIGSYGICPA